MIQRFGFLLLASCSYTVTANSGTPIRLPTISAKRRTLARNRNTKVRGHNHESHSNSYESHNPKKRELMSGKGDKSKASSSSDGSYGIGGTNVAGSDYGSTNIFDHANTDTTEVSCGSSENPFLTTFITSIQFGGGTSIEGGGGKSKSKKMSKSKGSASSGGSKGSSSSSDSTKSGKGGKGSKKSSPIGTAAAAGTSGDGFYMEGDVPDGPLGPGEAPVNELTPDEQRVLERTFEDVYNGFTFEYCDGFFRTVYTVSLNLKARDPNYPDYSVTLSETFSSDSPVWSTPVRSGTLNETKGGNYTINTTNTTNTTEPMSRQRHRHLNETFESDVRQGYWATANTPAPAPGGSQVRTQTITGGPLLTIYYVALTATCRNCAVTPEVNFPLLQIPQNEDAGYDWDTRQFFSDVAGSPTSSPVTTEDVCTCPAYAVGEEANARKRRQLQGFQPETGAPAGGDSSIPPPRGPTSQEMIDAMNRVIARNENLQRLVGLVQLVEPDYFDGENPQLDVTMNAASPVGGAPTFAPDATAFPTAAPLTRPPTATDAPDGNRDFEEEGVEPSGASTRAIVSTCALLLATATMFLCW